jgi:DNA helicase II / ATP-dependent DNA helicase PcrA
MKLDLNELNPEQRKAVENIEGPSMIIAGAGSGKTRVLTYKIANLINCGISPFEILALTFTNKAANEMRERISKLVHSSHDKIWMGTFHSMFARILRNEAEYIGFTRNFSIYDSEDSVSLVRQIMNNLKMPTDNPSPKAIHSGISGLKNKLILPSQFSQMAKSPFERKVEAVYEEYQKQLFKNNAMDFDDLLLKPIELFEKYPDALSKYQEKFKFILVDEYQDTNKAQYLIVKMLSSKYMNITIVGDDAQSIYKWRGAEIQNIFDFQEDFKNCQIFRLEQNYRSTQKILSIADCVIKKNKKQMEKNLWTENIEGDKIHLIETMTDRDEAYRISRYIFEEMQKRKLNFKDFVILYRTNSQSRLIEDSLRNNNIPYIIIGGIRFYQRKEIKDVLSNFKIVMNPRDNEAIIRILNSKEGIGKTTIEKLNTIAETNNLQIFDVMKNINEYSSFSARIKNLLIEIQNFIYKYQYLKDEISLPEIASGIIDETGILKSLRAENTIEAEERIANIQELLSAVAEFADTRDEPTLESFLQEVSLVADIDDLDDKKNAVTLMTIHSAKGLEYPVVFVTGLEEGLFPISRATLDEDELEEERRLFYVAVTRAMNKLYISFANQRYRNGMQSYQMKSRFLKEVIENLKEDHFIYDGLKIITSKKKEPHKYSKKDSVIAIRYDFYKEKKKHSEDFNDDKFPDIKEGVSVDHNTFGKGTVVSVSGRGLDKRAEIYFEYAGLKKIVLKYAKMRVEME